MNLNQYKHYISMLYMQIRPADYDGAIPLSILHAEIDFYAF